MYKKPEQLSKKRDDTTTLCFDYLPIQANHTFYLTP